MKKGETGRLEFLSLSLTQSLSLSQTHTHKSTHRVEDRAHASREYPDNIVA